MFEEAFPLWERLFIYRHMHPDEYDVQALQDPLYDYRNVLKYD